MAPPTSVTVGSNGNTTYSQGSLDQPLDPFAQNVSSSIGQNLNSMSAGVFGYVDVGPTTSTQPGVIVSYDTNSGADMSVIAPANGPVAVELPAAGTQSPVGLIGVTPISGLIYQPCGLRE